MLDDVALKGIRTLYSWVLMGLGIAPYRGELNDKGSGMDEFDGKDTAPHLQTGRRGESVAAEYLERNGWEIEAQNFTTDYGEIDIIARRQVVRPAGILVAFVEVKSRKGAGAFVPHRSVTARKRKTITRLARQYANRYGRANTGYRFDVIGVDLGENPPVIRHFEGAFDAAGKPY